VRYTPPNSAELQNTFIAHDVAVHVFGELPDVGQPRFSIYEFNLLNKEFRQVKTHPEWTEYIAVMALGDDDEPQFLSDPTSVKENGVSGKEFNYIADGSRKRFSKGRFFEIRNKLYVLCFEARSKDDLRSADGDKFLRSFRLL
jgi:hypothetical protein